MARSPLQRGPATDHYHDKLGVDQTDAVGLVFRRIGPVTLTHATAGFINPNSGNGVSVADIPSGSIVMAFMVPQITFDQPGDLQITLAADSASQGPVLVDYDTPTAFTNSGDIAREQPSLAANNFLPNRPVWGVTTVSAGLFAAFYPSGSDPAAGSCDIYAIIAVPAS